MLLYFYSARQLLSNIQILKNLEDTFVLPVLDRKNDLAGMVRSSTTLPRFQVGRPKNHLFFGFLFQLRFSDMKNLVLCI